MRYMVSFFRMFVFFFKQKTAYEMRISDWSSDVCSSDLRGRRLALIGLFGARGIEHRPVDLASPPCQPRGFALGLLHVLPQALAPFARFSRQPPLVLAVDLGRLVPAPRLLGLAPADHKITEELRVGKEGGRTWKSRCAP